MMDKQEGIAILGAGALGRLAANILSLNHLPILGFFDDGLPLGAMVDGIAVKGNLEDCYQRQGVKAIIGVGDIALRKLIFEKCKLKGISLVNAIHPTASIASSAKIGQGCLIKEYAVLEIGVSLGDNCIVGNGAVICHDTFIGNHCRLAPGVSIAGYARVEEECYLAVNVSVDRKMRIGARSVIASGCAIWENIPEGSLVKLPSKMNISLRAIDKKSEEGR